MTTQKILEHVNQCGASDEVTDRVLNHINTPDEEEQGEESARLDEIDKQDNASVPEPIADRE